MVKFLDKYTTQDKVDTQEVLFLENADNIKFLYPPIREIEKTIVTDDKLIDLQIADEIIRIIRSFKFK